MKNKIFILIILLISFLLTFKSYKTGIWSVQDDLHIFRLSEFDLCLKSGQIPCRYSPHSALGFGSPIFNFYPPVTYAIAEFCHLIGFSFIDSTKIIYLAPIFFGPIFMYLFTSIYFGLNGGLLSAIIFATAPYQALNLFVRGALAENFAINLVPVIFYFFAKKHIKLSIIAITVLLLTHQLTTLYAIGILIIFSVYIKRFKQLLGILLWSVGLSSFFLIPSILEKNLTTNYLMTQGYFNYIIHFATLKQLFIDRSWGYGASLWGPIDDMSFQIGYLQWLLPLVTLIFAFYTKNKNKILMLVVVSIGMFFAFLTHNKSTFVWQLFPFMAYFQFPWRFVGAIILCFSFMSGSILLFVSKKFQYPALFLITTISMLLNYNYFKYDQWSTLVDSQKLSGGNLVSQQGAGLTDFYPKYSISFPTVDTPYSIQTINGVVESLSFEKNSVMAWGKIIVLTENATITLPIAYFPNMELRLDTNKIQYRVEPTLGLIQFDIPSGIHHYIVSFKDTIIRTIANYITLLFLFGFIIKSIRESK